MASLLGQIAAVLAVALLALALARRAGLRFGIAPAVAIGALFILTSGAVSSYRESWHALDEQRDRWRTLAPASALAECAGSLGVDPDWIKYLQQRIPKGGRYYQPPAPGRGYAPDLCLRMLLLPRTEVESEAEADHVVLWKGTDPKLPGAYRRRGATILTYSPDRILVKLP